MPNHEQAVIDQFNRFFEQQALRSGKNVRSLALDGQDSLAGADYLLTDESRFCLVEFKYTQKEIYKENRKERRLKLCLLLEQNNQMADLHDRCHFIAWNQTPKMSVKMNIYRKEVCNSQIFGMACGLKNTEPDANYQVSAKQFTTDFLENNSRRNLSLNDFEIYLEWLLLTVSGGNRSTLELITYDDPADDCVLVKFESVRSVYEWFQPKLIIRLLYQRFGEIDSLLIDRIKKLSVDKLKDLREALLDFSKVADLENWLNKQKRG